MIENLFRCFESWPLSRSSIDLLFDALNVGIGIGVQVATFRKVLAQQSVGVLVATALSGGTRRGEVADCVQRTIDQRMLGKLTTVVRCERVHACADRMERLEDRLAGWVSLTIGYPTHT